VNIGNVYYIHYDSRRIWREKKRNAAGIHLLKQRTFIVRAPSVFFFFYFFDRGNRVRQTSAIR